MQPHLLAPAADVDRGADLAQSARVMPAARVTQPRSPEIRWSAALRALPALSVHQPWAWLIVAGFKDIENRSRRTHYRGPVLIHAGLNRRLFHPQVWAWVAERHRIVLPEEMDFGGVVGVVDLVDCVTAHASPWFAGKGFGYVLANPRRLPFRPCKGNLGLFRPDLGAA